MALRSIIHFASVPAFLIVAAVFLWGLESDNGRPEVSLMMISDPVPDFDLPPVEGSVVPGFSSTDLRAGQVVLENVFASWCFPCRTEHPLLMRIAEAGVAPIYGINYKDKPSDAAKWLAERGNPYVAIGADERGWITAAWGTSGIPETFIIDQAGMIRYRHAGALSVELLDNSIFPLIRSLRDAKK